MNQINVFGLGDGAGFGKIKFKLKNKYDESLV